MATPPPRASSSTAPAPFRLNALPSVHQRGRPSTPSSFSASFSFAPDSFLESNQLVTGDDDYLKGINNSSILPVSPQLLGQKSRVRRRRSNLSITSTNPNDSTASAFNGSIASFPHAVRGASPLKSRLRHPPVNGADGTTTIDEDDSEALLARDDSADVGDEDEDDLPTEGWEGMVTKMRTWRHDAMMQHLYDTAAFWGDKVLSWTGDRNDAFWLAQIHFLTTQYSRALRILIHPLSPPNPPSVSLKGKEREVVVPEDSMSVDVSDLAALDDAEGDEIEERLGRGEGGIKLEDSWDLDVSGGGTAGRRLVDLSLASRYLAAQCQVRMGLWDAALEMLGSSNPFQGTALSGPKIKSDGGFKLESSMCLLRGQIHMRLSSTQQAKECYLEALSLDVRCYDAFVALVGGEMMTVEEEWDTIQSLCYREQTEECAEFIRMMYTVRLKKYKHLREITVSRRRLEKDYALSQNVDVLFGLADTLYAQYKWNECYAVTSRILTIAPSHRSTLPLHLACMHHLPRLRSALFLLAHQLADADPEAATSWYAVGLWYFTGSQWGEARRYFGKASLMDPRFGPAWIAFAHSFALEKEHDQAITAYSTASRLFQGSHLPLLFIGMEHLHLQNISIAGDNLLAASQICQSDPLLFNEMGVVAYSNGDYSGAIALFQKALAASAQMQGTPSTWASTHVNLAHSLRKVRRYDEAREGYTRALQLDPICEGAHTGLGAIHMMRQEWSEAIECFHDALSLYPQSPQAANLLHLALDASIDLEGPLLSIADLPPAMQSDTFDPYRLDSAGLPCLPSEEISHGKEASLPGIVMDRSGNVGGHAQSASTFRLDAWGEAVTEESMDITS